jgi:hypothetical protein
MADQTQMLEQQMLPAVAGVKHPRQFFFMQLR